MMNNAQLAAASFDDIVFDGRNKGYGAYELRGLYQRHVSRALAIGTTIFALLVMFPVVAKYLEADKAVVVPPIIVEANPMDIVIPLPSVTPPPPPMTRTAPPPAATIKDTEFRVTRDEQATEKVPEAAELATAVLSTKTTEGPPLVPGTIIDEPVVPGPATVADVAPPVAPYTYVEQMPELPGGGGVLAIVAAIQKSVRYPSRAINEGVEGKLYASFVVNFKGEVVDVKIVKGLGFGLDEETMRAIKSLPRFIPGKQNGREVNVAYTVPVTFKIQ